VPLNKQTTKTETLWWQVAGSATCQPSSKQA